MPGGGAAAEALHWEINGLKLSGLAWGDPDARPLLALHGWLDNAASFARLGPLLRRARVVAPDMTGHGRSDRRSADASYQIWDDLPEMLGIADALGWRQFDLLGHSRGAIVSTLLAAAFPERVRHLVLLDAVAPEPVAEDRFPAQMRRALEDKARLLHRPGRVFADLDAAVSSRARRGLSTQAAELLAQRGMQSCEGGVTWRTDQRLRGASPVKLTAGQIAAVLEALDMPTLLLLAEQAPDEAWSWMEEQARRHIGDLRIERVAGGHHFHMEDCAAGAARLIEEFLDGPAGREVA